MEGDGAVQCIHSKAEILWLMGVRFLLEQTAGTVEAGLDMLREGDAFLRSDGVVGGYVCEYDEAFYHEDVQRDVRKTVRLLEVDSTTTILRLRRGCAALTPLLECDVSGRLVEVCTDAKDAYTQVCSTAAALGRSRPSRASIAEACKVASLVHEEVSKKARAEIDELARVVGQDVARSLLRKSGVKTRLWTGAFREGVGWLLTKVDNDPTRLPTIMCNSLASRLGDKSFREGVGWLVTKVDNDSTRLPTIMCDGLASRLGDEKFREGVGWLLTKVDNDPTRLPTIMCGSLASRLGDEKFREGVDWLLTKVGNDPTRLPTIMCNSLASRLGDEKFREGVGWLLTKVDNDPTRLPTIMCGSLASRLGDKSFREGVEWLLTKVGNDPTRLPTIMCDGLASRLGDETFREGVDSIIRDCSDGELALIRLVKRSPFVSEIPFLAARFRSVGESGKRCMEQQLSGSYSRKRQRLIEWKS